MVMVLAASCVWLLNIGFSLWRAFHDWGNGKRVQATIGLACVLGVNAVLGWMIYTAILTSADL